MDRVHWTGEPNSNLRSDSLALVLTHANVFSGCQVQHTTRRLHAPPCTATVPCRAVPCRAVPCRLLLAARPKAWVLCFMLENLLSSSAEPPSVLRFVRRPGRNTEDMMDVFFSHRRGCMGTFFEPHYQPAIQAKKPTRGRRSVGGYPMPCHAMPFHAMPIVCASFEDCYVTKYAHKTGGLS